MQQYVKTSSNVFSQLLCRKIAEMSIKSFSYAQRFAFLHLMLSDY